jgi:hypothetical protein
MIVTWETSSISTNRQGTQHLEETPISDQELERDIESFFLPLTHRFYLFTLFLRITRTLHGLNDHTQLTSVYITCCRLTYYPLSNTL